MHASDRAVARTLVVGAVAAVVGLVGTWLAYGPARIPDSAPHLVAGWSMVGCGLAAWSWASWSRCGPLLVLAGLAWFIPDLTDCLNVEPLAHRCIHLDPLASLAGRTAWIWLAILAHAILTFPDGRARATLQRALVIAVYALGLAFPAWEEAAALLVALLLVAGTWLRRTDRETDRSEAGAAFLLGGGLAVVLLLWTVGPPYLLELGVTLVAIGLLAGLSDIVARRAAIGPDQAVGLGPSLATALGDPGFRVWFPTGDDGWVDSTGADVNPPRPSPSIELTSVERDGVTLAVIAHDRATLAEPEVRTAVTMAIELAAHNARLRADLADQLSEVGASRRRLLDAGLRERQELGARVERDVERPLARLGREIEAIGSEPSDERVAEHVARAADEVAIVRAEIGDLVSGLFPRVLAADGLAAALHHLATRSPVPIDVVATGPLTSSTEVDATIYFVCAEALANAARHARASRVSVMVTREDGAIAMVIADDGAGGADASRGSGLRGLCDRVEALGGSLVIDSPLGMGTRLAATIPVGPEARGSL